MISQDDINRMFEQASAARAKAYAPYSHYRVGAALLADSGLIYSGCNIENASYGATICAERNAVCAFVMAGETKMQAIGIVAEGQALPYPCGICRQVLAQWGSEILIFVFNEQGDYEHYTLAELLPYAFTINN